MVMHRFHLTDAAPRADALKHELSMRGLAFEVVAVVRANHWKLELFGELAQDLVERPVLGEAMVLKLDEEVPGVEGVAQLCDCFAPDIGPLVENLLCHVAAHACAQADDPLAVLLEHLEVDARLIVDRHPVDPASADEAHQVLVALLRAGEQQEMMELMILRVASVSRGEAHFAPEDRLHVGLLARAHQLHGAKHVAVVGQRDGRHSHLAHAFDQLRNPNGAVQHRELAVNVQVNEFGRHERADSTVPDRADPPGHGDQFSPKGINQRPGRREGGTPACAEGRPC